MLDYLNPQRILGIDVDPHLIDVAQGKNQRQELTFKHCDITQNYTVVKDYLKEEAKDGFEVVFCFSVSMWIHLNHGEEGLKKLLHHCHQLCKGIFVLEPQPWKCYMTAARRMRKLKQPKFHYLDDIQHRQEALLPYMNDLCQKAGFSLVEKLGQTNWDRQILLYKPRE